MENPRAVNRLLLALLGTFTAAAVGASIRYREFSILLGWLATITLFFVVSAVLGLFNVVVFAPVFWVMARFASRRSEIRRRNSDDQAA